MGRNDVHPARRLKHVRLNPNQRRYLVKNV